MSIRRATPADAAIAARIIAAALAEYGLSFDPDGRDADVAFFGARPDHDDFVAEIESGPAGIASVGPHGDPGIAWVSKVFVDRAARRRGLARALLHATHDSARARGYTQIALRTRTIFTAAIALYESEGYVRTSDPRVLESGDIVLARAL
jgi:putative acetyltransferase